MSRWSYLLRDNGIKSIRGNCTSRVAPSHVNGASCLVRDIETVPEWQGLNAVCHTRFSGVCFKRTGYLRYGLVWSPRVALIVPTESRDYVQRFCSVRFLWLNNSSATQVLLIWYFAKFSVSMAIGSYWCDNTDLGVVSERDEIERWEFKHTVLCMQDKVVEVMDVVSDAFI